MSAEVWTPPVLAGDQPVVAISAEAQEAIDERAAIMEVDAGLQPEEALDKAKLEALGDMVTAEIVDDLNVENLFLNQWNDSVSRSTDAPRPLVLFAGVGLLSSLCHKYFFFAPRETYLNLYLFILGPSSSSRKTTVLDMVRDYLVEVEPDLVLPNEFTAESLFSCLSKRSHGTVFSRELNSWLDQMLGVDYNRGLASTLGNLYDHAGCVTRETKKDGLLTIQDPVITILGAGVDEYLIGHLREMDMVSGFWPRVTLVRLVPQVVKVSRPPGKFLLEPQILDKLRAVAAGEGGEIGFETIEPLRQAYATTLYQEAAELGNANLAAAYTRLEWILVKIGALLQLVTDPHSKQIKQPAFNDAVILVDYVKRQLPDFYGERLKPDPEDKLAAWVLNYIKKHDKNRTVCVPYGKILHDSHMATAKLRAAIERLFATDECEETPIPAKEPGGRPGKAYRSKGESVCSRE